MRTKDDTPQVQEPRPETGISTEDVQRLVAKLKAEVKSRPALKLLLKNVPKEYDPNRQMMVAILAAVVMLAATKRSAANAAYKAIHGMATQDIGALVDMYEAGTIDVGELEAGMREIIKDGHIAAFVAGRGGAWGDVTYQQWGTMGRVIRDQYQWLANFMAAVRGDTLKMSLRRRALLYADAMRASLESGFSWEKGLDPRALPAMPGDGSTECLVSCKCRWHIRKIGRERFRCTWRLGRADHCQTCPPRADDWVDLEVHKGNLISSLVPHFHSR